MGINRGTVLDLINDVHKAGGFSDYNSYSYLFDQVDTMPESKEDAEPHWIPVTEEPKEEKKSYWVCLEDGGQCQCRWTNDIYGIGANAWSKWGWKKADLPQFSKVVAYMPLPEPYKGVTE